MENNSRIIPRNKIHQFEGIDASQWCLQGDKATDFFNSLFMLFNQGEKYFIRSVRQYNTTSDDVVGFIGQEAQHGREHEKMDSLVYQDTPNLKRLNNRVTHTLQWATDRLPPSFNLAATAALEHWTATLAHHIQNNPEFARAKDAEIQRLVDWHALEEIEHKCVTYDVYQSHVNNDAIRYIAMVVASTALILIVSAGVIICSHEKKRLLDIGGWKQLFENVLIGKKSGFFRKQTRELLRWFHSDFHPLTMND